MNAGNSAPQNTAAPLRSKTIAARSFLLITGKMIRFIVQMTVLLLYARKLSPADYGLYQSMWLYLNVISIFSLFGLPSLLLATSSENIREWIGKNRLLFLTVASLLNILPALYIFFGSAGFDISSKVLLVLLSLFQNISIIIETGAVKKEKEAPVLAANFIFSCGFLAWHILLLYRGYSISLLLTGIIIMFIIKSLVTLIPGNRNSMQSVHRAQSGLGRQWFYLGLNDILGVVSVWLDKWVILLLLSLTQFAVYFNGAYEIPVFGIMLSAVGNIMLVEFSKSRGDEAEKTKFLFGASSQMLAAVIFPSFCFLLFNHTHFFTLLFSDKYAASIPVFFISIFILPVRIIFSTTVLQVYSRSDLIVKGALLDIALAVAFMLLFYPLFGMKGLALSFVISSYLQAGFYLWQTGKLLNKKITYFFPVQKLSVLMLISFTVTAAGYFAFSGLSFILHITCATILCALLAAVLLRYVYKKELKAPIL